MLMKAQTRAAKAFAAVSLIFVLIVIPLDRIAAREATVVSRMLSSAQHTANQSSIRGHPYMGLRLENSCVDAAHFKDLPI